MNEKLEEDEEQEKRANLRRKFLSMLKYIESSDGRQIDIQTYRGACVSGMFRSVDYNMSNVHVHDLNTPIGLVHEALLRTSDIVSIKFKFDSI